MNIVLICHLAQVMNEEYANALLVGIFLQPAEFTVVRRIGEFVPFCRSPYFLQGVDDDEFDVRVFIEFFVELFDEPAVQPARLDRQIKIPRCLPAVKNFIQPVFQTEYPVFECKVQTPRRIR